MSPRFQSPLSTEYILLGLISQGPDHGYDLHKRIGSLDGLSSVWHVKQSQMYALLDKLEQMGLLQATNIPGAVYAQRKQYQVTPSGQDALDGWMISPVTHGREMRQEFLARLYFARLAGPGPLRALLDAQYAECRRWQVNTQAGMDSATDPNSFQHVVDGYRLNQINAMVTWLDECRKTLLP